MLRAVEDPSAPIPDETTSELGRIDSIDAGHSMRAVKASPATPYPAIATTLA